MADHASAHVHGEMDIRQNQAAFDGFVRMTKWGSLAVADVILMATLWFCTDAGFLGAMIAGVVLAAVGIAALRDKH